MITLLFADKLPKNWEPSAIWYLALFELLVEAFLFMLAAWALRLFRMQ